MLLPLDHPAYIAEDDLGLTLAENLIIKFNEVFHNVITQCFTSKTYLRSI